jgi:hypothetical protein
LYLGCFPQRSTATVAALPAMSLAPVAPFVVGAFNIDSVIHEACAAEMDRPPTG